MKLYIAIMTITIILASIIWADLITKSDDDNGFDNFL